MTNPTQEQMDQKIYDFYNQTIVYRNHLRDFMDAFEPLSNEDEEIQLKQVNRILSRYIKNNKIWETKN